MSTLMVLAVIAAAVSAATCALVARRAPRRGRHGGGAAPAARALTPALPLLVAGLVTAGWLEPLAILLAGAGLWLLCLPLLALTGRMNAWGHATWALSAGATGVLLTWSAWWTVTARLAPLAAACAWLLWAVLGACAVALLRQARRGLAISQGAAAAAPTGDVAAAPNKVDARHARPVRWPATVPSVRTPVVSVTGVAALALLALVVQPAGQATITPAAAPTTTTGERTATPGTGTASEAPSSPAATPSTATTAAAPVTTTAAAPAPRQSSATSATSAPAPTTTASPTSTSLLDKILPTPSNRPRTPGVPPQK